MFFILFVRRSLVRLCQKKKKEMEKLYHVKKRQEDMAGRLPRTQQNK